VNRVLRSWISADGQRRLQLIERDDGYFSFSAEERALNAHSQPCWTPIWPHDYPICETAEIAEREAVARVDWLDSAFPE
jgi:hypothetical protein